MIRVYKDFDSPPTGLVSASCRAQQQRAITEKASHLFSSYHYRDSTMDALRVIYKNKCGYCETAESAGASLRVDHYRPKDHIKHIPSHDGYYWLGYEWSNLILSCEKCNRQKSNQFPLQNEMDRVSKPVLGLDNLPLPDYCRVDRAVLLNEFPLLINPEVDQPEVHLNFLPTGQVEGKTERGSASIDIYFLYRDELVINRKKMTDDIVEKLKKHLLNYLKGEIDKATYRYAMWDVYEEAALHRQADRAYSRVAKPCLMISKTLLYHSSLQVSSPMLGKVFSCTIRGDFGLYLNKPRTITAICYVSLKRCCLQLALLAY